jgi:VWFA-related protein
VLSWGEVKKRIGYMHRAHAFLRPFLAISLCAPVAAAGQSTQAAPATTTIRAETNLVVEDVTVTDAHGNPVHNLTAADFTLLEDRSAQTIKAFEEHTANDAVKAPQTPRLPNPEPGVFTNSSRIPATGSLNIVLLDQLNTPMADQVRSREQLSRYLAEAPAGMRIALLKLTSSQLVLLQGFTTDPELLRAAVAGKGAASAPPVFLNNAATQGGVGGGSERTRLNNRFREQLTLDALNQLGRYLGQLPGRKNLIWFSTSFPVSIQPDGIEPTDTIPGFIDEFKETVNLLAHYQVAVYPVAAGGLAAEPLLFNTANPGSGRALANPVQPVQQSFSTDSARQSAMEEIAEATGGQAFMNTNDLKGSVAKAIEAGSNYYALAYSPTSEKWKGQYRRIQIQLARKGLNLEYRRGYYATDPNAPVQHKELKVESSEPLPYSVMRVAMVRGGPEPSEIRFWAKVRPSIAEAEPVLAKDNHGDAKATGPFRRYNISYVAPLSDIRCPVAPDGTLGCALQFEVRVYDADGALINTQDNQFKATIKPEHYASLLQGPHPEFRFQQEISVPVKGEYYLRLGIHDLESDRVGAVELPVSAVSVLPPLSAVNAGPAARSH